MIGKVQVVVFIVGFFDLVVCINQDIVIVDWRQGASRSAIDGDILHGISRLVSRARINRHCGRNVQRDLTVNP